MEFGKLADAHVG